MQKFTAVIYLLIVILAESNSALELTSDGVQPMLSASPLSSKRNGLECLPKSLLLNGVFRDRRASISRPYFQQWRGSQDEGRAGVKNLSAHVSRVGKRTYTADSEQRLAAIPTDIVYEDSTIICFSSPMNGAWAEEAIDKLRTQQHRRDVQDQPNKSARFLLVFNLRQDHTQHCVTPYTHRSPISTASGMSSRRASINTPATNTNENESFAHDENRELNEHERARVKEFGQLFNRRSSIDREALEELFRKEPSEYTQTVYRYASRIFHCLKEEQVNPVLKALLNTKEEQAQGKKATLDVPKIDYASDKQKRRTLKLAFSVLRYQKVLEELLDETQFFSNYPELKDELSLVCTILYDYLSRKFQPRDDPVDVDDKEDLSNNDQLISSIENAILHERTHLAAALARNRIKSQALSLEDLLPENVREVQQHSAELPVYAWVNLIKTDMETVIEYLENEEQMTRVKSSTDMGKRTFCIDYHCSNLLVFHYSQKQRIANHRLTREHHLYLQDKSSCIAAHTVRKLITRKDNICLAYVSGGLLLQLLLALTDELESKIYAFGARNDENVRDILAKVKSLGASEKRVKIFKERFNDVNFDETNVENCKVILCNPPDTRSALIQPLEFLYHEGEDVSLLKQFSQPTENKGYIRECIQREAAYMRQAVRYIPAKAIVYVTFSKNRSENDDIVHSIVNEQNEQRTQQRKENGVYKISPPVLPIQFGVRNEHMAILRQGTFIQFESSQKMNGVFVAVLLRERERRRSTIPKKKVDEQDSDLENERKSKKEQQGFQFETEARAAQRRQQQQQTGKSQRRASLTVTTRRSKSNAGANRDLTNASLGQFETRPVHQPAPAHTEPKQLTLSERLASIGRITSTLDTTQDEPSIDNDLIHSFHQHHVLPIQCPSYAQRSTEAPLQATIVPSASSVLLNNKENNQSLGCPMKHTQRLTDSGLFTVSPQISLSQTTPISTFNKYAYPVKQCKITLEHSKSIVQRCHTCRRTHRSLCRHYDEHYDIDHLLRKALQKLRARQSLRKQI